VVKCFIIIKHTISYELTTLTHTMMIGQLHTSSIDLYVKPGYIRPWLNMRFIQRYTDWIR